MAVTNAVNLTDGIDGLAAGTTAIVGVGLGILAYATGNIKVSQYLNIIENFSVKSIFLGLKLLILKLVFFNSMVEITSFYLNLLFFETNYHYV